MNINRILLLLTLAVVKLAKTHKLKGRECAELFELIDTACEIVHQNDCQLDGAIDDAQRLANDLELTQDDLGRKIKTMELNEEEYWKQRAKLTSLIDQAMQATGKNKDAPSLPATRHVLEEMQDEFPRKMTAQVQEDMERAEMEADNG